MIKASFRENAKNNSPIPFGATLSFLDLVLGVATSNLDQRWSKIDCERSHKLLAVFSHGLQVPCGSPRKVPHRQFASVWVRLPFHP